MMASFWCLTIARAPWPTLQDRMCVRGVTSSGQSVAQQYRPPATCPCTLARAARAARSSLWRQSLRASLIRWALRWAIGAKRGAVVYMSLGQVHWIEMASWWIRNRPLKPLRGFAQILASGTWPTETGLAGWAYETRTQKRASGRDGGAVMTQPPSPLTMLFSRHTKRREFITLVGGTAAAWPYVARAQQAERERRIGVLMSVAADGPEGQARLTAFQQGLQQLGCAGPNSVQIAFSETMSVKDSVSTALSRVAAWAGFPAPSRVLDCLAWSWRAAAFSAGGDAVSEPLEQQKPLGTTSGGPKTTNA